jgi:hypothetical protein
MLVVLLAYAGQGVGLVVACGFASRMLALIVTPLAIAPFILFTPYAVDERTVPHYFRPVLVASPFWVRSTDITKRSERKQMHTKYARHVLTLSACALFMFACSGASPV